jgi:hypothetical protein
MSRRRRSADRVQSTPSTGQLIDDEGHLFAQAFMSDPQLEARSKSSAFIGSKATNERNTARHELKRAVTRHFNSTNGNKAAISACALAYSSMIKREIGEELVKSSVVSSNDRLHDLQAHQKEEKQQLVRQKMAKKGATVSGARLSSRNARTPPARQFFEAEDVDKVELTLLKDLRALYDTRDKDDEDSLDGVDENLYTDLALLQREAIRFTPEVQIIIGELFEAVDMDFSESIEEHEYKELVIVLYECLRLFWDEDLPELSKEELTAIAYDDWAVDADGYESIDFDRFVIAMFKLCDVWTVSRLLIESVDSLDMVSRLQVCQTDPDQYIY